MLKDFYSEVWTQDYPSHYPCLPTQNSHLCESNPHICISLHLVQVHSVLPLFIFTFGRDVFCIKSICEHRNEIHTIKTFYLAFIAIVLLVTVQAAEINLRWNESELNKTRAFFFFLLSSIPPWCCDQYWKGKKIQFLNFSPWHIDPLVPDLPFLTGSVSNT